MYTLVNLIIQIFGLMQDFNPILCFRCFFESNVQFEDKVWTALGLHGFAQISPYACATT